MYLSAYNPRARYLSGYDSRRRYLSALLSRGTLGGLGQTDDGGFDLSTLTSVPLSAPQFSDLEYSTTPAPDINVPYNTQSPGLIPGAVYTMPGGVNVPAETTPSGVYLAPYTLPPTAPIPTGTQPTFPATPAPTISTGTTLPMNVAAPVQPAPVVAAGAAVPATSWLQQSMIPGVSNQTLLIGAGAILLIASLGKKKR
jgi:hypothetical protein